MFDRVPGTLENMFNGIVRERLQPQFFYLAQLLGVREGGVVLVVVVKAEQREYLVQRFDMRLGRQPASGLTLPRTCR